MRVPPIAWAGLVTLVVLVIAVTAGILLGPVAPPGCASPSASASASVPVGASPAACVTASPTP